MHGEPSSFKELFKKYRLKAEIPTLSQFGHLLAEKGFNYEDSIFSHWQSGTRVPQYRAVHLKILEIFCSRGVVTSVEQANELLRSGNQYNLSDQEIEKLGLRKNVQNFQVPNRITNFTGREEIIKRLTKTEEVTGRVVVIYGPAGIGKTALAIELGHLLREKFKDGVLWYKIEEDNISDIFLSIAKILGEDISGITDLNVRSTVVRSLLASKNILLFLDSAELYPDIYLLIANSTTCTTIITSQGSHLKIPLDYLKIEVRAFNNEEVLSLFRGVLVDKYSKISKSSLLKIGEGVGNLPLALHLLARELLQRRVSYTTGFQLEGLKTDNLSLNSTISMSYNKLDSQTKSVLVSASIFKGKDFSLDSIAYINGLSRGMITGVLENLISLSLLEYSTRNRYRIHPAIKDFVRNKLNYPRSSHLALVAILIFVFFVIWWIFLQVLFKPDSILYRLMPSTYFVMALYGGVIGLNTSLKWGGLKTLFGKAIFMYSVGLFLQVFGQIAYSYYTNILHVRIPYPSIGDIGYFGTIPFYIFGTYLLAESSGVRINFRLLKRKPVALIIPIIMVLIAYFLFLQGYKFDFTDPIKIFLDFGYPLGEAIYISIVIIIFILSRTILDGIMRSKAFLLLIALLVQFVTDYLFVYDSANYYSGNYIDFLCLLAYFTMTIALLSLRSIQIKVY